MDFFCKECGVLWSYDTFEQIVKHEKLCISCFDKVHPPKKYFYENKIKDPFFSICCVCGKTFSQFGNRTTCSKVCQYKKTEKTRFYHDLKIASLECNVVNTRVFGQGKYEKINYIGDLKK